MLEKEYIDNWYTSFAAGAVLISIPIAILFLKLQKYYVNGMAAQSRANRHRAILSRACAEGAGPVTTGATSAVVPLPFIAGQAIIKEGSWQKF